MGVALFKIGRQLGFEACRLVEGLLQAGALEWAIAAGADEVADLGDGFDIGEDDATGAAVEDLAGLEGVGIGHADDGWQAGGLVGSAHPRQILAVIGDVLGVDEDEVEAGAPGHADPQGGGRRDQRAVDAVAGAEGLADFEAVHKNS